MNIQPTQPGITVKTSPSAHPADAEHKPPIDKKESNRILESKLSAHLAEHPAIKKTIGALTNSIVDIFLKAHGEKKGWANIIKTSSPAEDTNPKGSGVIKPYYYISGSVGWNGATIKAVKNIGSFAEKAALYYGLMNSQALADISEQYKNSPALQKKLEGLVDPEAFKNLNKTSKERPGWTGKINDTRQLDVRVTTRNAGELLEKGLITAKEHKFHQTNPINHPGAQERVGFNHSQAPEDVKVAWAPGKNIWRVKEGSEFSNHANQESKPTVSGVSGTTARFMTAAKVLAPACMTQLGINNETAFKELVRAVSYAYMLPYEHHSMLEVNLSAAAYGLEEQWNDDLYDKPFSNPIQGKDFYIDNDSIQQLVNEHRKE